MSLGGGKERETRATKERKRGQKLSIDCFFFSLWFVSSLSQPLPPLLQKKRQPFRRRGAHPSSARHHRGDPSESGGFGGRRRDGGNGNGSGTFPPTSSASLSLGTKLLKLFLANWDRALVLAALIAVTVLVSTRGLQFLKDALAWLQRHS